MNAASSRIRQQPFIRSFLRRLPAEVATTFTADQLAAVQRMFGMRYTMEHLLDLRRTVRLPWGRFYLVVLAGRDDRQDARWRLGFAPLAVVAAAVGAAGAAAVLLIG